MSSIDICRDPSPREPRAEQDNLPLNSIKQQPLGKSKVDYSTMIRLLSNSM